MDTKVMEGLTADDCVLIGASLGLMVKKFPTSKEQADKIERIIIKQYALIKASE